MKKENFRSLDPDTVYSLIGLKKIIYRHFLLKIPQKKQHVVNSIHVIMKSGQLFSS